MSEALNLQFTHALLATIEEAAKLGCYSVVFNDVLGRPVRRRCLRVG